MSLKTLAGKVTGTFSKQILTIKTNSPAILLGVGVVGVTTSVVLACRATLKLSDVLEKGEEDLEKVKTTPAVEDEEERSKAKFGVQLQTAIKVVRLYTPSALLLGASIGALAGSHVILQKRNASLVAAYTVVSQGFKEYRARVVADQGKEKDFEYRFGKSEKEIAEEGKNGPEVSVIKGPDQDDLKHKTEWTYARVFDRHNPNWSDVPHQNQNFIHMVESSANRRLIINGYLFLNDVYEMLGFPKTQAGQQVGWVVNPAEGEGDGIVDFGVWNEGTFKGVEWISGQRDALLLDFNVDGVVTKFFPKV
ncbi:hypothetical protein SEA_BING_61 [Streptomyces phage Bing]|uniref:Uncharacterized protein n=1 Tax=Streptomyces phage Bing TaxID=2079427 RepID=A0A2L1IWJ3_9CAUD|nr:hypothetical protein FDJ31_gp61 [Streptomyces phage Bing]AVD99483.1 hypothetical protein SEA_BING_61 [Streptomyces phage Bing]